MDINEMRNSISVATKKGISFTLAAMITWIAITIIYRSGMAVEAKNFVTFFAGGVMFPLSVLFSKITGAQWKTNDHPLGALGLILNFAQLMYFPMLFWAFNQAPERFILFYAIITMAHLFPYGWLYRSKAYYTIAPFASIALLVFAGSSEESSLWIAPSIAVFSLILLNSGLYYEGYLKEKRKPEKLLKAVK